jgi:hypothetical protein
MTTIDDDENLSPGAQFMQSAGTNLGWTRDFISELIEQPVRLGGAAERRGEHKIDIDLRNADGAVAFRLPVHIRIDEPTLASKILDASLRKTLRVKGFHVVAGYFTQPRLVLLLKGRVVGQLFCSRDGQTLELEIKERPDARDMGNAVLALGRLEFNVHTPLGSASADTAH